MRDMMIDIETLGTTPGSVILSIGAVAFDAEQGEIGPKFSIGISVESSARSGMTIDPKTVVWWVKQSDAARQDAFGGEAELAVALHSLGQFLDANGPTRVWAKPPAFDLILLEEAYRRAGVSLPWHYRAPRCVRTIMDLADYDLAPGPRSHCSLDDAVAQANAVIASYARITVAAA